MTKIDISDMSEDDAIYLYHRLAHKFGWNGTFFTRQDAQDSYNEYHNQDGDLSDELWERIRMTWYWRKGLDETLTERGWDLVHASVMEAIHNHEDTSEDTL